MKACVNFFRHWTDLAVSGVFFVSVSSEWLPWCLVLQLQAGGGGSSSGWQTGAKAGPWPAQQRGGRDQQHTSYSRWHELFLKVKQWLHILRYSETYADFHWGAEWEVKGGVAANGERRSSCIRGTATAQGCTWRTEPSDLLPAISPQPAAALTREYNAQNPSCRLISFTPKHGLLWSFQQKIYPT